MPWQLVGNIRGPQGPTGSPGSVWTTGNGPPTGSGVVAGDSYLDGVTGEVYTWNGTTWVAAVNISGPQGDPGPAGEANTWQTGSGAPSGSASLTGDLYLDTTDGDVYEWTGSAWQLAGNLVGPTGDTGPQGPQGNQGPQGPKGDDGRSAYQVAVANGYTGTEAQWLASLVGPEGPEGPPGDPNQLAPIALSGSADDLTSGTIPEGVLPDRLKAVSVTLVTTGQVDAATSAGFYGVDAAGSPTGAAGSLLVLNGGGTPTQVFTSSVSGRMHARVSESGVWGDWNPVAYLDVSRWVTEDGDGVTTEDGDQITFITGVR